MNLTSLELKITDADLAANGSVNLSIDVLIIAKGPNSILFEAENATLTGVTASPDDLASNQQAVTNFGHASGDSILFSELSFPEFDPNYTINYQWDVWWPKRQ